MRKLFFALLVLAFSLFILVGSSGTFVTFSSERSVRVAVVPHEEEYLSFLCNGDYAAVVVAGNESVSFEALTVGNDLSSNRTVWVFLSPDYSGLLEGVEAWIDDQEREIPWREEYTFMGTARGNVSGEYVIPITFYARWADGDAVVETCPVRVIIENDPSLEKVLLSGNTTVASHTYQEWTFQIVLTNPGEEDDFVVKDTIPGEFDVLDVTPSKGTHTLTPHGHSHELLWSVHLEAGEAAHVNVTIATRINGGGNQEFTDCGVYSLNDGARIVGTDVVSNSLEVESICSDCGVCVSNTLVGDPESLVISENTPGDYTTLLTVRNDGAEKDVSITQNVGEHFSVTGYTPSKGTVTLIPLSNGKTRIVWNLHLASGEVATLEINEHTDGIEVRGRFLLTGTPKVGGCGNRGDAIKVRVVGSTCRSCFGRDELVSLMNSEE